MLRDPPQRVFALRTVLIIGLGLAFAVPAFGAPESRDGITPADAFVSWLMAARAAIEFSAETVTTAEFELSDIVASIELRDGRAVVERGTATTQGGTVTFNGTYTVAAHELRASIHSDGMSLASPAHEAQRSTRLFAPVPLVPRWLPGLSGALEVHFDRLSYGGAEATALHANALLEPSRISIALRGSLGVGALSIDGAHSYASGETTLAAMANAVELDAFAAVSEYLSGAKLDGTAELRASGHTMRDLAASVDGSIRAQIGPGTLNNLQLERLHQNVLAMTLLSVIPLQHPAPQAPLNCAALRLDLVRGRSAATAGPVIVARSDKLELIGKGTLDLGREQIALKLQPAPQTGLALGAPGNPRTVSITGSLRAPVMKSKAGDLLHESLSIGTSLATNPLARAADTVFARNGTPRTSCAAMLGD